jgi:acetolactate synthase-1/2/3 large subunit
VTELARKMNFPVTTTIMGLGGFPASDEHYIGWPGMHGSYEANMALHNSDLILSMGARFDDRVTNATEKFCPTARIIHVDIDPSSISKTIAADVPIVGPTKSVATEMLSLLDSAKTGPDTEGLADWWQQINEWRKRHGGRYETNSNGVLKPQQVIEALHKVTKGDAYICSDVGQHQMFAAQYYPFEKPNRWINSGGLGTMGFGFPAAMGVKLHYPDAEVVCVTGEGSFQMNLQEFSTCSQYGLPVKIVCLNNGSLGMVRQWQDMNYESRHSQSYMQSLPDFEKLTEAYGHVAITVTNESELMPALEKAFAMKDRLVFLDIHVDPDEHVYPMQVPRGSMREMWLSKSERT